MQLSATEAKNRLGQVLAQSQSSPVFIEKAGRKYSVVISNERYEELIRAEAGESIVSRRKRFNEQYKDWIAEQNERFEQVGVMSEEFRAW